MRSEIELFLNLSYNQERIELFKKCFSVFEEFHLEDYDHGMLELISMYDSMDPAQVFLEFDIIVKNTLISVIQEHGIELDIETNLDMVCEIARCLNAIQTYEDKDSIVRTLESEYDNEEKLAQLFRFVSIESVDNFMLAINNVDQNIFSKLYDLYKNIDIEDYSEEEILITNKIIKNLKEFKAFVQYDQAIGFKLLTKGLTVNRDFNLYIKYCLQKFETMELGDIAKELLVILFMSKQSYASPIMFFRSVSNTLFDDINKITKIDVLINTLINDFNRNKAQQLSTTQAAYESIVESKEDDGVPEGTYLGFVTGYEATFFYNDQDHIVKLPYGVKGRNIPCKITKSVDGHYSVEQE